MVTKIIHVDTKYKGQNAVTSAVCQSQSAQQNVLLKEKSTYEEHRIRTLLTLTT